VTYVTSFCIATWVKHDKYQRKRAAHLSVVHTRCDRSGGALAANASRPFDYLHDTCGVCKDTHQLLWRKNCAQ